MEGVESWQFQKARRRGSLIVLVWLWFSQLSSVQGSRFPRTKPLSFRSGSNSRCLLLAALHSDPLGIGLAKFHQGGVFVIELVDGAEDIGGKEHGMHLA